MTRVSRREERRLGAAGFLPGDSLRSSPGFERPAPAWAGGEQGAAGRRAAAAGEGRLEGDFGLRLGGTNFTLTLPSPVKGEGEKGMRIG